MLAMEYGIWNFPGGLWSTTGLAAFSNATLTPIAALPSANDSSAAAVAAAAAAAAGYTITAHGIIGNVAAAAAFQAERLCNESTLQSTDNNTSDQNSDSNSSDANQDGAAIATESETQTDLNLTNDLSNACDDNAVDNHIKIESQIGFLAQQYAPVYNFVLGQFNNNQNVQTSETEESSDEENTKATLNENSHQNSSKDSATVVQTTEPVYEVVSEPQMHKCPVAGCDYKAAGIDVLEKHVTTHSEKGGKNKKGSSMQRIRYEREEYHCGACTYTCTTERAYVRHLRAHAAGEADAAAPRVSCAVCGRDRRGEAALARHMRKHREDRFFCCDLCVFRTVQLKKLIQHRRMHTGEKPHLCPHCTYRSARRDNLRSHVRRVHKRDNLLCDTFSPRGMLLAPSSASTKPTSENNNAAVTDQNQIAATTNTETVSSKQSIE